MCIRRWPDRVGVGLCMIVACYTSRPVEDATQDLDPPPRAGRQTLLWFVKIVVSAGLLYVLLSRVDLADALPAAPGDRFLLATDGIVTLDDAEVTAFLAGPQDASTAVHDLLAAVEHAELPGQDNVTVVAVLL